MKFESQKIAYAYFLTAMILFLVQVSGGLLAGWIYVSPNTLSDVLPFNIVRMLHTNSLIVWLLLGFFGAAYFLLPEESEREIYSPKLAYLQLAILVLGTAGVVVTYLFDLFHGNFLLGKEGREFLEQPKWVKAGIVVAALIFLFNLSMTVLAGAQDRDHQRSADRAVGHCPAVPVRVLQSVQPQPRQDVLVVCRASVG